MRTPNLAARPFENLRPIRRATLLLWLAAVGLAAWNARTYATTRAGTAELVAEVGRREGEVASLRVAIDDREGELTARDLGADNARTRFLNERIAERTFSWNRLLDRMAEALPRTVRLVSLAPSSFTGRARQESRGKELARFGEQVEISLQGVAEDSESLLEFVDRLFAHPAFRDPNLAREAQTKQGQIEFGISLVYLPAGEAVVFAGVSAPDAPAAIGSESESTFAAAIAPRSAGVERSAAGAARGFARAPRSTAAQSATAEESGAEAAESAPARARARDWRSASDRSAGEGRAFIPAPLGPYASDTGRPR